MNGVSEIERAEHPDASARRNMNQFNTLLALLMYLSRLSVFDRAATLQGCEAGSEAGRLTRVECSARPNGPFNNP